MANDFPKEIQIAFDDIVVGFDDNCILSNYVGVHNTSDTDMERSSDIVHLPVPYISRDVDGTPGTDISAQFADRTQLVVPAAINQSRAVPYKFTAKELRDSLQEGRMQESAKQKLASVVNVKILETIAEQGSVGVMQSAVAGSGGAFLQVADAQAQLDARGVPDYGRCIAFNPFDANGISGDLANRARIVPSEITGKAYARSYMDEIAGFDAFRMQYGTRIAAAAGSGDTIDTTSGAADYTPQAKDGNNIPVDNRTQQITVSNTTGVVAGDYFTIAGCESVHLITKEPTGQLQTFKVRSVDSGTTMTISPPIIAASSSPTVAEQEYKNCEFTSTSATAAISYINTTIATSNVFWQKDSVKLLPGRYNESFSSNPIMRATTKNGIEITMERERDINTKQDLFRFDIYFGVVNLAPEMNGVILFGQT